MEEKNYWMEASSKATCMDKLKLATLKFLDCRLDSERVIELYDDVIAVLAEDDGDRVLHIVLIMEGFDAKTPTRSQFEALLIELMRKEEMPRNCAISMDCAQYNIIDPERNALLRYIERCQDFGEVIS